MTPRNYDDTDTAVPVINHNHSHVALWAMACLALLLAGTLGVLQFNTNRKLESVASEVAAVTKVNAQQQSTIDSLQSVIATNQSADVEWKEMVTKKVTVATETGEQAQKTAEELGIDVHNVREQIKNSDSKQQSFITGDQAKVMVSTAVKPLSEAQGQASAAAAYVEARADSIASSVAELQTQNAQLEKKVRGSPAKKALSLGTFLAAITGLFFPK